MTCSHPPEDVLCGPLYEGASLLPFSDGRPQNIREQDEERAQWCSRCGALRWYRNQEWGPAPSDGKSVYVVEHGEANEGPVLSTPPESEDP